jgi:CheY-like chemotaxis protein
MIARRKQILLVDDSITSTMVGQMALRRESYDITTARNGVEGMAKATGDRPDLILLDISMPVMDGFEMLRELRKREETRSIPVIMVSSSGEMDDMEAAYTVGCNDYITKPVDPAELVSKVASWLGA